MVGVASQCYIVLANSGVGAYGVGACVLAAWKVPEGDDRHTHSHTSVHYTGVAFVLKFLKFLNLS